MQITETRIEEMIIGLEDDPDEEIFAGYSISATLENGRELLLADITADTHPAMDAETHKELGSPTLAEAQQIAQLLAAAPQMQQIIKMLAVEALQNNGQIPQEQAIAALEFVTNLWDDDDDE